MAARRTKPQVLAAAALLTTALALPEADATPPPVPPPPASAAHVDVIAGQLTAGIDVALRPVALGAIAGRIRERGTNRPLQGLQVLAFSPGGHIVRRTTTAANGTYSLNALPAAGPGYHVCFRAWHRFPDVHGGTSKTGWVPECTHKYGWSGNNATVPDSAPRVPVDKGQTTQVNATLRPGGALKGTVTKHGGRRGIRADVYVRSVGAPHYQQADGTDGSGRFRIIGLPPAAGGYQICVVPTPDETTPTPGYVPRCRGTSRWFGLPRPTGDNADVFTPPRFPAAATHLPVHLGRVTGAGVEVRPAGAIRGRISDRLDRRRVGDPVVRVYTSRGHYVGGTTAFNGRYKVTGLPPSAADYVCVFPNRYHELFLSVGRPDSYQRGCYRDSRWTGRASRTAGTPVSVTRGQVRKGVVILLRRASRIKGTLTSAHGGQRASGRVYLYSTRGTLLASEATGGHFSFMGLPASRSGYLVCATAIHRKHLEKPWLAPRCYGDARWDGVSATPPGGAQPIPIGANVVRSGIDIALRRGGALSGQVKDKGFHAYRTRLYVIDNLGRHIVQTEVRADGTWSVEGLDARSYRVCFANPPRHWQSQPTCYKRVRWFRPWVR